MVALVTVQPTEFAAAIRWSPKFEAANLRDDDDVQDQEFVAAILSTLPAVGEPAASDIYALTHARVCELTAGSQGEALFLEGPPLFARSDEASARANASLICSSVEAVEKFVEFCRAEAASVLAQHEHVVRAISAQLRIRRTLNGAEVD